VQEDLSKFVRLCFDYPLTGQAKEKVWPVLDRPVHSPSSGAGTSRAAGYIVFWLMG
jgi:hypothetical protein